MTATDQRSQVMIPGHCTFCGRPAEQHIVSRRWWHTGQSCGRRYVIVPAAAVPVGPLGFAAQWPARFRPGPYVHREDT